MNAPCSCPLTGCQLYSPALCASQALQFVWPSCLLFHHWYSSRVLFIFALCYSHNKCLQSRLTSHGNSVPGISCCWFCRLNPCIQVNLIHWYWLVTSSICLQLRLLYWVNIISFGPFVCLAFVFLCLECFFSSQSCSSSCSLVFLPVLVKVFGFANWIKKYFLVIQHFILSYDRFQENLKYNYQISRWKM